MRSTLLLILLFSYAVASAQLDSLKQVLAEMPDTEEKLNWIPRTCFAYRKSDPDILEALAQEGLVIAKRMENQHMPAVYNNILGSAYWLRGDNENATIYYLEALRIGTENEDYRSIASSNSNLGNVYDAIGNYEKAIDHGRLAVAAAEAMQDTVRLASVYLNLGKSLAENQVLDTALFYFYKAIAFKQLIGDVDGEALLHNNVGSILLRMDSLDAAEIHLKKANATFENERHFLVNDLYSNLGVLYAKRGRFKLAHSYLDSAIRMSQTGDDKISLIHAYQEKRDISAAEGNYREAFDVFSKLYELDQSFRGEEVQKKVEVLQLKYEEEKNQKQIALLEKEKAEEQLFLFRTMITGVFVIISLLFMILILRLKVNNSKLKEKDLQNQLIQKKKELTSYALNFIQKNELMSDLTEKINELKKESLPDTNKGLSKLNHLISDSFRIDQDWENFKLMFEEVHPDFFTLLKKQYAELSNAELKLSALLRLNMNLKESSRVLGISPESVKTARYRLRKKLKLEHDDNLVDFFLKFNDELTASN
ncbi:Tetratricopeptide repeat-containing protein [Reichenbachiella faecimaris]|uniref:Tetratricopeptide repeat-containing protein n=1 Tax=Reichenbachiella faecimaris TaxID=692418 RepID=A0A1W2G5Y9_REIFA|nr:transcriptional regulator [Reichenbachiella faecimaris]SMD32077.1 Tetratricopeptide repeat-containing protein [Reichenbachiella faecimaris]